LNAKFPEGSSPAFINVVATRVPTFLYFDEYFTLPGAVAINEVLARKQQNTLTDRDQIFLALLSLAGTTLENVVQAGTLEEFNSRLPLFLIRLQIWSSNTGRKTGI
jgi:hypothetical protein